ncbi:hypothetical protein RND71_043946 [Anisodus tanguticus]|uniref:branched-chain-amino-acid transaminase n=1 Tax=Anisodus tanguticus TaxID=243964 RepID=A0AAE1QNT9_9SOLA|nr:hypothetical protein RND71_043946 [Anisodus tanguticus]
MDGLKNIILTLQNKSSKANRNTIIDAETKLVESYQKIYLLRVSLKNILKSLEPKSTKFESIEENLELSKNVTLDCITKSSYSLIPNDFNEPLDINQVVKQQSTLSKTLPVTDEEDLDYSSDDDKPKIADDKLDYIKELKQKKNQQYQGVEIFSIDSSEEEEEEEIELIEMDATVEEKDERPLNRIIRSKTENLRSKPTLRKLNKSDLKLDLNFDKKADIKQSDSFELEPDDKIIKSKPTIELIDDDDESSLSENQNLKNKDHTSEKNQLNKISKWDTKELKLNDFTFLSTLGKGFFGSVYLSKHKLTDNYYAVKVLKKKDIIARYEVDSLLSEKHMNSNEQMITCVTVNDPTKLTNYHVNRIQVYQKWVTSHALSTFKFMVFKNLLSIGSFNFKVESYEDLQIIKNENSGMKNAFDKDLQFGHQFTDHMFEVKWTEKNGWEKPLISPFHNFNLHPASKVFHYAQELFEGMKAYRCDDGAIRLFRPEMNMARMIKTSIRAGLPEFDKDELLKCIKKLIKIEENWVPNKPMHSLYIRPTFIGIEPTLGVSGSKENLLYVILCPVGSYFKNKLEPVALYADVNAVRAWPGGCGDKKMGSNYAPTIKVHQNAIKEGCQQVLWLFGDDHQLTEIKKMEEVDVVSLANSDNFEDKSDISESPPPISNDLDYNTQYDKKETKIDSKFYKAKNLFLD